MLPPMSIRSIKVSVSPGCWIQRPSRVSTNCCNVGARMKRISGSTPNREMLRGWQRSSQRLPEPGQPVFGHGVDDYTRQVLSEGRRRRENVFWSEVWDCVQRAGRPWTPAWSKSGLAEANPVRRRLPGMGRPRGRALGSYAALRRSLATAGFVGCLNWWLGPRPGARALRARRGGPKPLPARKPRRGRLRVAPRGACSKPRSCPIEPKPSKARR